MKKISFKKCWQISSFISSSPLWCYMCRTGRLATGWKWAVPRKNWSSESLPTLAPSLSSTPPKPPRGPQLQGRALLATTPVNRASCPTMRWGTGTGLMRDFFNPRSPALVVKLSEWALASAYRRRVWRKLQALVYDIRSPTTAIVDYAIGLEKLSANEQFLYDAQTAVSL